MPSIAIIVPCYNEAERLQAARFLDFAAKHPDVQFYFINDGSIDATKPILTDLKTKSDRITVVDLFPNRGKGEAIREGMIQAISTNRYNYIGFLDADLSTSLQDFYNLYKKILSENKSVVFGSRIKMGGSNIQRSYARHLVGRTIATLVDRKFDLGYYDTQCGAKIFSAEILKPAIVKPFLTRWFFDIEIFLRLKEHFGEYSVLEMPLNSWHSVKKSKLNILSFGAVVKEIYVLLTKY